MPSGIENGAQIGGVQYPRQPIQAINLMHPTQGPVSPECYNAIGNVAPESAPFAAYNIPNNEGRFEDPNLNQVPPSNAPRMNYVYCNPGQGGQQVDMHQMSGTSANSGAKANSIPTGVAKEDNYNQ